MRGLPKKAPVVATHTLVALAAAAAGAERILNLVIDNHPQWFVVAPGALNLVQGPRNYYGFLQKFEAGGVEPAEARAVPKLCDGAFKVRFLCAQRRACH